MGETDYSCVRSYYGVGMKSDDSGLDLGSEESCLDTFKEACVFLGTAENYNQFIKNKKIDVTYPSLTGKRVSFSEKCLGTARRIFKSHGNIKDFAENLQRNFTETLNFWKLRKNEILPVLILFICFYVLLLSSSMTQILISLFIYLACVYLVIHCNSISFIQQLFLLFCAVVGVSIGSYNQYLEKQYFAENIGEWVAYFTDKRFDRCDDLAYGSTDLLLPANDNSTGTFKDSEEMYTYILDTLVDGIEDISYNEATHMVTVKYRVYKDLDSIKVDEKELSDLKAKYIGGELADEDFRLSIEKIYFESFKNSVLSRKTDKVKESSVELQLLDGKVEGGYTLVKEMLVGSGIYDNMQVFESDIKSTLDVLIRSEE